MNRQQTLAILIMLVLIAVPLAIAAPTGGIISGVTTTRANNSGSQTIVIQGGNLTQATVTGRVVTDKWAGFYGNATGQLFMGDAVGNTYYQWTTVNMTGGVVYASDGAVSDWTNLRPANEADVPAFLQTVSTDNFNVTFAQNETFTSATITKANVSYVSTWQNISGTAAEGNLKTYSLYDDTGSNLIFAGKILDNTDSFVGGATVDYQMIVPAQASVDTTYYFYLEMP